MTQNDSPEEDQDSELLTQEPEEDIVIDGQEDHRPASASEVRSPEVEIDIRPQSAPPTIQTTESQDKILTELQDIKNKLDSLNIKSIEGGTNLLITASRREPVLLRALG